MAGTPSCPLPTSLVSETTYYKQPAFRKVACSGDTFKSWQAWVKSNRSLAQVAMTEDPCMSGISNGINSRCLLSVGVECIMFRQKASRLDGTSSNPDERDIELLYVHLVVPGYHRQGRRPASSQQRARPFCARGAAACTAYLKGCQPMQVTESHQPGSRRHSVPGSL